MIVHVLYYKDLHVFDNCLCTGEWQGPEALVEGMFLLVAPVLQVDAEAVVSLAAQFMDVFVSKPELWV